jgi:hypothetical protein
MRFVAFLVVCWCVVKCEERCALTVPCIETISPRKCSVYICRKNRSLSHNITSLSFFSFLFYWRALLCLMAGVVVCYLKDLYLFILWKADEGHKRIKKKATIIIIRRGNRTINQSSMMHGPIVPSLVFYIEKGDGRTDGRTDHRRTIELHVYIHIQLGSSSRESICRFDMWCCSLVFYY